MFGRLNKLVFGGNAFNKGFQISVEDQKEFLNKTPIPKDLFERSYNQYLSQQFLMNQSFIGRLVLNFFCFLFIPFYLIIEIVKGFFIKETVTSEETAVFPYKGRYGQIIPEIILKKYEVVEINFSEGSGITSPNYRFIFIFLFKYWFSPFFVLKCLFKLSFYNYIIAKYNSKMIIGSNEYSFVSSILTEFCYRNKVSHVNVMHGEKLFSITDSWFQFDKFYVWDEHYVKLFKSLNAYHDQFVVEVPENLKMNLNHNSNKDYFLTYYLAGEDEELMKRIKLNLDKLNKGKICIRYHPRYNSPAKISTIFSGYEIENPYDISLKESFEKTLHVSALFSTILLQGYLNGMNVVIDNVAHDQEELNELRKMEYILLKKDVGYLSEFIK